MSLFLFSCSGQKPQDLGLYDGAFSPCPSSPNCISSEAKNNNQYINFFTININHGNSWQAIHDTVSALKKTKIITFDNNYLHAESASNFFGFVDDIQLHLRKNGQFVAIKSAARLGHSDFGVNRKRIEHLRQQLLSKNIILK